MPGNFIPVTGHIHTSTAGKELKTAPEIFDNDFAE